MYIAQHSCGDCREVFPELVEAGLQIYNTFQPEVYDIEYFKERFGDSITFYGGISTQKLLPYATPDELEKEMKRIIGILGKDGGYIISSTHAMPNDIPTENVLKFVEVCKNQGGVMISFESDYTTGACPEIIKALTESNLEPETGYLEDRFCKSAARKIADACGDPDAQIYFVVGGTQANSLVIGASLKDYQGVIAANTGHIALHEGGAIEYTGHKVIGLGHELGKVRAQELEDYLKTFYADENNEKMVYPGMLYVSHPTEYGTLYTKAELEELARICHEYGMQLYLDGARLGYGLAARDTDVTLKDIYRICDVFYIGGTKVGALCGEAIVYTKHNMPEHFRTIAKQRNAMLAKGRLLGIQFDTLFTDGLYFELGKHAIDLAMKIKETFAARGYKFLLDSPTNQQFVILEDGFMNELKEKVGFAFWEKYDENHTVVRFASSWSTTEEDMEYLFGLI